MTPYKPTIVVGLNELNIEFIKQYAADGRLPHFRQLLDNNNIVVTQSEAEYALLEPWIQWVTIHTGKTYAEHQVYRLGDIVERPELAQIYEDLENAGHSVGAVSPFNAANRLKDPHFFVPDPWTDTPASGTPLLKALSLAVHQAVNDNAKSKISMASVLSIVKSIIRYVPPPQYLTYAKLILGAKKPGRKAVILDTLLADTFLSLFKKHRPDFSTLFLNTGAHLQHHYMFNSAAYQGSLKNPDWYCPSSCDPLLDILEVYDSVLGALQKQNINLIVLTGLHQEPHEHNTYYWRLNDHAAFLKAIGITSTFSVDTRMSRDFLMRFDNTEDCLQAEHILTSVIDTTYNERVFSVDNRGASLFVELTFAQDITPGASVMCQKTQQTVNSFADHVSFVAIKNGEHHGDGYLIANFPHTIDKRIPLTSVRDIIFSTVKDGAVATPS